MRISLLLWLTVAGIALAMAPPPPPSPLLTAAEIDGLQESIDRSLAGADRWEQLRGDRQIPWANARGHMAIVIDDIGRELHLFEQLYGLRYRLTFAVLPSAVYSAGVQLRLRSDRRRPREILLHLPMEPKNRAAMAEDLADGQVFLELDDPPATLRAKTEAALARVPSAIGVNNHMGSALTADRIADDTIVQLLRERGLFVLDSLTGPDSKLFDAATDAGVPALRRSFFLDHEPEPAAIEHQLELAAAAALQEPVVVIAHPSSAVVKILRRELPRLHSAGITVVPLSKLLQDASGVGER